MEAGGPTPNEYFISMRRSRCTNQQIIQMSWRLFPWINQRNEFKRSRFHRCLEFHSLDGVGGRLSKRFSAVFRVFTDFL